MSVVVDFRLKLRLFSRTYKTNIQITSIIKNNQSIYRQNIWCIQYIHIFVKCEWLKTLSNLFICKGFYQSAYRIANKTNKIPIITIRHAPSVPPTITGKLSDKEAVWGYFSASGETGVKINYYIS